MSLKNEIDDKMDNESQFPENLPENRGTDLHDSTEGVPDPQVENADKWTAQGRSVISAAIIGLIIIGALYVFAQTVFAAAGIMISGLLGKILISPKDAAALISSSPGMFVTPIRWAVLLSEFVVLLFGVILFIRRWHTPHVFQYVRLTRAPITEIFLAVIGTVMLIPVGSYISNAMQMYFHINTDMEDVVQRLLTAYSMPEFLFLVIVAAIAPAICEEFFFRGYIQRTFERSMGVHSVFLVGVLFGLFHFEPLGLITLSLIGIWLGFVYYRSKSLLPNMAGHFTNNFIALWIAYRAPVILGVSAQSDSQIPILWVLATIPLFALIAWIYYMTTASRCEYQNISKTRAH